MSAKAFNLQLDRIIQELNVLPDEATQKTVFDVFAGITDKAPVDKGRFRASWRISQGKAELSQEDKRFNGGQGGAASRNQQELQKIGKIKGGEPVYITNSLPYAEPLENGHSSQAPNGAVAVTLAEVAAENRSILGG